MHPDRTAVLQLGSGSITGKHFNERGLRLIACTSNTEIAAKANLACGILITEPSGKVGFIRECFADLADVAEDSGLAFGIVVPTAEQRGVVERLIQELQLEWCATVSLDEDIGIAAEYIARRNPGPPLRDPKILPAGLDLPPRTEMLLRRCFYDCDRIYLEQLGGGRDAAGVFCVHAWLGKSIVGPRPLPFFIKFSDPTKIESERTNYERYADSYIPFYLRPNLVPSRCARIKGLASLVGNFVEDSVPLRTALRASQSPGIIFSLFEVSLRGFRSQPASGPTQTWDESLEAFLRGRSRPEEVMTKTVQLAQSLGLMSTPTDLTSSLCSAVGSVTRKFSPYHGDLHAGNVMVRGKDAILIDFSAVKNGPLTADPATLEVSLVFGTDENDKPDAFNEWKKAVDEFYDGVSIHEPPSLGTGPGPFAWLCKAIREIRHVLLGCDCHQEEAAEVLAAYLLRFARLPADKFRSKKLSELARKRQAYALVVAERIVNSIVSSKNTQVS
jgi:hypothetical protein